MIILTIILSIIIFALFLNYKKVNEKYNRTIHTLDYNQRFIADQEAKIKEQEKNRILLVEKNTNISTKLEKANAKNLILNNTIDDLTKKSTEIGAEIITHEELKDGDVVIGLIGHSITNYYFYNDKLYYFDGDEVNLKVEDFIAFIRLITPKLRAYYFDEKVNELEPQHYIEYLKAKYEPIEE